MAIGRIPEPGTGIPESIVDAKGDLISATGSDAPARLAVGANGTTLVADSSEATGLKWATASASASTFTLINSGGTAASGSSVTISSLGGYNQYMIVADAVGSGTGNNHIRMTFNSDSSGKYNYYGVTINLADPSASNMVVVENNTSIENAGRTSSGTWYLYGTITGANGTGFKNYTMFSYGQGNDGNSSKQLVGYYEGTAAITSITFALTAGTFSQGTFYIYGAN